MRRILYSCCLALCCIPGFSQKTVDLDKQDVSAATSLNHFYTVAGVPFLMSKFSRVVSGTPFFKEQIMKGAIILSEGREYRNMYIRINLLDGQVNYIDEKNIEIVATTPIKEVVIWDTIFNTDFRFVNSDYINAAKKPEKDFYELLIHGKAELYKQHKKLLSENRPYGSATYEQTIETQIMYFVLYDGNWVRVKKLKELPSLLSDKTKEVLKFISDNRLSGDNEENFKKVMTYYNSLFIEPA